MAQDVGIFHEPVRTGKEEDMKKWMIWVSAMVVVCFVSSAFAVTHTHVLGQVKSVDVKGRKIVVKIQGHGVGPETKTFFITNKTKILLGGREKTLADIHAGKTVMVAYDDNGRKRVKIRAKTIVVQVPMMFGTIKRVDAAAGKIVVNVRKRGRKEPIAQTFLIDKETKIGHHNEKKTLADLSVGQTILVEHEKPGKNGEAKALSIRRMRPVRGPAK